MLFQELTPDTSVYMIAGYTIFFVVTAIYLASLYFRTRNLDRDLDALRDLEQEEAKRAASAAAAADERKPRVPRASPAKAAPVRKKATRKS